jgi:hypothetical protein
MRSLARLPLNILEATTAEPLVYAMVITLWDAAEPSVMEQFVKREGRIEISRRRLQFYPKAMRRLAVLRDLPHGGVGRLDVVAEAIGVEQRIGRSILRQPLLQAAQHGFDPARARAPAPHRREDHGLPPCRTAAGQHGGIGDDVIHMSGAPMVPGKPR